MIWDDSFSVEKVASLNPDLIVLPKEEFLAMTTHVEQLEGSAYRSWWSTSWRRPGRPSCQSLGTRAGRGRDGARR